MALTMACPDTAPERGRPAYIDLLDGELGLRRMQPALRADHAGTQWMVDAEVSREGGGLQLSGFYPELGIRESLRIEPLGENGAVIRRSLTKETPHPCVILGAFLGSTDPEGGPAFADRLPPRFAHVDNVRLERFPWCRADAPYVRTLPLEPTWFGNQDSQPVPAILLTNQEFSESVVVGQLAQAKTRLRFRLSAAPRRAVGTFEIDWDLHTGGWLAQKDDVLECEPVYVGLLRGVPPQDAFEGYYDAVSGEQDFPLQATNPLFTESFYCSWNYGIGRNFTQESLLKTARCIREHLPHVKYFLIDGGWQSRELVDVPDCSNFYRHDKIYHKADILPDGMDGLAERLRALDLKPALWWTPSVDLSSTLAREHPEWLAQTPEGGAYRLRSGYLDYSLPAVQAYIHKIFDILFRQWGYVGMKMDFWSQSVESEEIRFKHGTGIEWRDWLLSTIQSYLPEDGFLMTCVATAMGNPFLGKHAQTYRACIDVGDYTHWHDHIKASCWVQPLLHLPQKRFGLLNVDGLGVSAHVSDDENLHRLTYGFITMGSLEIDGRLEELEPRHLEWVRRLTLHTDRGYRVRCPEIEPYTGDPYPRVLYVDYPPESPTYRRGVRKHVAVLNWEKATRCVAATAEQLGLEGTVAAREFWTDAETTFEGGALVETLPPHGARLYEIAVS